MQDSPNHTAAANLESLEHSTALRVSSSILDNNCHSEEEEDDLIYDIAEIGLFAPQPHDTDEDSNYSLDYEYIGPRQPKYAISDDDCESIASEISAVESDPNPMAVESHSYFDMWDEDIYSTNDYTWESNDMRLSLFVKQRNRYLRQQDIDTPWHGKSFWRKDRGWPMQVPNSCSTTNHDQSAGTLCVVKSDLAVSEHLVAFYKDRIIKCGAPLVNSTSPTSSQSSHYESHEHAQMETQNGEEKAAHTTAPPQEGKPGSVFLQTHVSVSLPAPDRPPNDRQRGVNTPNTTTTTSILERCSPYTKSLKRSQFIPPARDEAYVSLGFEPLCLDHNYGYMAVGGVEGELLVYCSVDPSNPVKIWGTKFKRRNNVMLMTNAVQIVRWRRENGTYHHMLLTCMNEAGVLVYNLPPHSECEKLAQNLPRRYIRSTKQGLTLHSHLRGFQHSPINDARVSPDGNRVVFVGDDSYIFLRNIMKNDDSASSGISFGPTQVLTIPPNLLSPYASNSQSSTHDEEQVSQPYSSQHVAWNNDSTLFAHTSDSHYCVLVWTVESQEIVITIDAAGYTYAVAFHPSVRSILAFSNRYGYFHTVDLNQGISVDQERNVTVEEKLLKSVDDHNHPKLATENSKSVIPRQEITMVSFRGEKNPKLRILAKINGLRWSGCGKYLYVATKKRVLVYEFLTRGVKTLVELAGDQARKILELDPLGWRSRQQLTTHFQPQCALTRKRKRLLYESFDYEPWYRQWKRVPEHLQYGILGDNVGLDNHD